MMQHSVIAGFPGVGKTVLAERLRDQGERILDSDSSKFDKRYFPTNYIRYIETQRMAGYIILCSTHKEVREALVVNGIPFTLVYPEKTLKDQYLDRYRRRGSPAAFVAQMNQKWDDFISDCESQIGCVHVVLGRDQFLDMRSNSITGRVSTR